MQIKYSKVNLIPNIMCIIHNNCFRNNHKSFCENPGTMCVGCIYAIQQKQKICNICNAICIFYRFLYLFRDIFLFWMSWIPLSRNFTKQLNIASTIAQTARLSLFVRYLCHCFQDYSFLFEHRVPKSGENLTFVSFQNETNPVKVWANAVQWAHLNLSLWGK